MPYWNALPVNRIHCPRVSAIERGILVDERLSAVNQIDRLGRRPASRDVILNVIGDAERYR
jgi:hypothetical protein